MGGMVQTLFEQVDDVVVIEAVIDGPSLPTVLDQTHRPQDLQLVGDGRLGDPQGGGEVVDAELLLGEEVEQLDPGEIAKDLEGVGNLTVDLLIGHPLKDLIDSLLCDAVEDVGQR